MKKLFILLVALFVIAGCSNSEGTTTEKAKNEADSNNPDVTVVKIAQNILPNVPYSYLNEEDKMVGYTVDYMQLIDNALEEYEFKYELLDSEAMLIGVETGKYALAANYYLKNPEREKKYLFPEHHFGFLISGFATKSDREDILSFADMAGKTLTPMNPSGGTRIIIDDYNKKHPDNPILVENIDKISYAESLRMVDEGKYDAFFVNKNIFENVNAELKLDLKLAALVTKDPIWLLFNKEQDELAARIDEVTAKLIEDGALVALSEKWFKVDMFQSIDEVNESYSFE